MAELRREPGGREIGEGTAYAGQPESATNGAAAAERVREHEAERRPRGPRRERSCVRAADLPEDLVLAQQPRLEPRRDGDEMANDVPVGSPHDAGARLRNVQASRNAPRRGGDGGIRRGRAVDLEPVTGRDDGHLLDLRDRRTLREQRAETV
jgi:hypothetical protein